MEKYKPVVLIILDGWGIAPPSHSNAITLAKTPFFSRAASSCFTTALQASGLSVGLPSGEQGNSEVGHLNLGAGKIFYQTLPLIDKTIEDKSFFKNEQFLKAIEHVKKNNSKFHLLGLVSKGNVHSSINHLYALLDLCKQEQLLNNVFIHAILDGRDAPYNSALEYFKEVEKKIKKINLGKIASLSGRFYAMDRDNYWERTEKFYLTLTEGEGKKYISSEDAIDQSYKDKIFDEEFIPSVITENSQPIATISDNDAVIFFNFRADRARQITKAFVLPDFKNFQRRKKIQNLFFVTMTEYEENLPTEVALFKESIEMPLARVISEKGLTQLHIAETIKYAHVTYFFNGGREKPFINEDWILIPSPRISSYDQKPAMSALELTEKLIPAINEGKYDFILVNFANPDMVAHTGNMKATINAIEFLDELLKKIAETVYQKEGALVITADHGNAEELVNLKNGQIDKEHSTNSVPFILIARGWEQEKSNFDFSLIESSGFLHDVAPTILKLMGFSQPKEMTGRSLI